MLRACAKAVAIDSVCRYLNEAVVLRLAKLTSSSFLLKFRGARLHLSCDLAPLLSLQSSRATHSPEARHITPQDSTPTPAAGRPRDVTFTSCVGFILDSCCWCLRYTLLKLWWRLQKASCRLWQRKERARGFCRHERTSLATRAFYEACFAPCVTSLVCIFVTVLFSFSILTSC